MTRLSGVLAGIAAVAVQAAASPLWAQCAMCRESLKSGGSREMITGYMYSTLLLTTVPFLILTTFGILFYRAYRQQQRLAGGLSAMPAADTTGESANLS